MSKRTIRIPDGGWRRCVGGATPAQAGLSLQHCNRAAVEKKFQEQKSTDWSEVQCESELKNILVDGITLESNEEKEEAFAKAFSDIRSNKEIK